MDNGLEHESTIRACEGSEADPVRAGGESAAGHDASASYFHRIARALDIADEILVVGPSETKLQFVKYMHKNEHAVDPRILGVETIARFVDIELAAFAKLYFSVGGPMRSGN